jgi:hypothetical protein
MYQNSIAAVYDPDEPPRISFHPQFIKTGYMIHICIINDNTNIIDIPSGNYFIPTQSTTSTQHIECYTIHPYWIQDGKAGVFHKNKSVSQTIQTLLYINRFLYIIKRQKHTDYLECYENISGYNSILYTLVIHITIDSYDVINFNIGHIYTLYFVVNSDFINITKQGIYSIQLGPIDIHEIKWDLIPQINWGYFSEDKILHFIRDQNFEVVDSDDSLDIIHKLFAKYHSNLNTNSITFINPETKFIFMSF